MNLLDHNGEVEAPDRACKPSSVIDEAQAPADRQSSLLGDGCPPSLATNPRASGRAALRANEPRHPLLDLAPDEACLAAPVTWRAGGLLHRRFTLTLRPWAKGALLSVARFCRVAPSGCCPAPCSLELGLSSNRRRSSQLPERTRRPVRDCPAWSGTTLILPSAHVTVKCYVGSRPSCACLQPTLQSGASVRVGHDAFRTLAPRALC
jgi:hypothetical protein